MRWTLAALLLLAVAGCGPRPEYDADALELGKAVSSGSASQAANLISKGADPNQKVPLGAGSPMHIAAEKGDVAMLRMLIEHGGKVDAVGGDFGFETPLGTAARYGKIEAVKFLLGKGANPNGTGAKGMTPLADAATLEIAKTLVQHGADVDAKDRYGSTPLDELMATPRNRPTVLYLLTQGSHGSLGTPAREGDVDLMRRLIASGTPVDDGGPGFSSVHHAVQGDSLTALKFLVEHGARVDLKDREGAAPLLYAAEMHHPRMIAPLLAAGAGVRDTDELGRTALHLVAAHGDLDAIEALIGAGSNVNAKDSHGWTPLFRASSNDHPEAVKFLLEHGADPKVADDQGRTAMDLAKQFGWSDVLAVLEATR